MQTAKEDANLLTQTNDSITINLTRSYSSANGEFPLAEEQITTDFSEIIAENFGANATYVETLLARWQSNPSLVDESWRAYFEELVGSNGDAAVPTQQPAAVTTAAPASDGAAAKPAKAKPTEPAKAPAAAITPDAGIERIPIRGPALKIVENMEASLAVPTATTPRRIPLKLLHENRRLINRHLQDSARRKAPLTH